MIIAIDFDGTIVNHEFPMIGKLKPNAKMVLKLLDKGGHFIIIWTCRTSQNISGGGEPTIFHVRDFLTENDIPFGTINNNCPEMPFQPSPKVYADVYIDDRNIGFIPEDWIEIYDLLIAYHGIEDKRLTKPKP